MGWDIFSDKLFTIVAKAEQVAIINDVKRVGIRYINFFEADIFKHINLNVTLSEQQIAYKNTIIRIEVEQESYKSTLQIANKIINNERSGSIIDIDTFITEGLENFFKNKEELIANGHAKEKELFFSLLKDDFLQTLNPQF